MNKDKQFELEKIMKKLDFIRSAFKSVSYESAVLKKEKEDLEVKYE
jgi:hypothetical protein